MSDHPGPNPYVGPHPFTADDQLHGRDSESRQLTSLIVADRIVMMYSPSGAGKTSLIQASVIPRLKQRGFRVLPIVHLNRDPLAGWPGEHNRYLAAAMMSIQGDLSGTKRVPASGLSEFTLTDFLAQMPRTEANGTGDVLVFDQFEEAVTLDPTDEDAKGDFFEQLGEALENRRTWALFSMREEYVSSLRPFILPIPRRFDVEFRLDLLDRESAVQAIVEPAREAGVTFDADAAELLADQLRTVQVQQADGSFEERAGPSVEPVQLQVVCERLWGLPRSDPERITVDDVDAIDDEARSLVDESMRAYYASRVAAVAEATGTPERAIRRWLDEDMISAHGVRLTLLKESDSSGGMDNDVIDALIDARLLRGDRSGGRSWIELAHDRLVRPVTSDNEEWNEANLTALQRGAVIWAPTRSESLLLRDKEYSEAKRLADSADTEPLPIEAEFLAASEQLAQRDRRNKWVQRIIVALLIGVLIASAFAWVNLASARRQERLATSRQLAAQASLESTRADVGLLLAQEAVRFEPTVEAQGAVLKTLEADPALEVLLHGHTDRVLALAFSPDGRTLATSSDDMTVRLYDTASGALIGPGVLSGPADSVYGLAFGPDGRVLAASDDFGEARLWDPVAGGLITEPWVAHEGRVRALAFNPADPSILATGGIEGTITIWNIAGPVPDALVSFTAHEVGGQPREVRSIAFSPDGSVLASGGDDFQVRLWDPVSGGQIGEPVGDHDELVRSVAFSPAPDRRVLVSVGNDHRAILWVWDAETGLSRSPGLDGETLPAMHGHTERIYGVAFAPDGNLFASASRDGTIVLWDSRTGGRYLHDNLQVVDPLTAHSGAVRAVAFQPGTADGEPIMATAGNDRTVGLWQPLRRHRLGVRLEPDTQTVLALARHPQENVFVSPVSETSLQRWDLSDLAPLGEPMTGHTGTVRHIAFSWDGQLLASAGDDCSILVWDHSSGDLLATLVGHSHSVTSVTFSPGAGSLVSASQDGRVLLWDLSTERPQTLARISDPGEALAGCDTATPAEFDGTNRRLVPTQVWFTPDGKWLIAGSNHGSSIVWEWADDGVGEAVVIPEGRYEAMPFPLGETGTAVALKSDEVLVWDLADKWTPLDDPGAPGLRLNAPAPTFATLGPPGTLVSASNAGGFRLWDLESGRPLGPTVPTGSAVYGLVSFADALALVTAGESNTLIVWDLDVDYWSTLVCPLANRNLSQDEWSLLLPGHGYKESCPGL